MSFPDGYAHPPVPDANAPLLAIADLAPLLGLTTPVAAPLAAQIGFASAAVSRMLRNYCARNLTEGTYTEDFRQPDYAPPSYEGGMPGLRVNLTEWPVTEITAITVGAASMDVALAALNHSTGRLWLPWSTMPTNGLLVTVEYTGGYDPIPGDLQGAFLDLVRRQLSAMGVDLAASGSSIPAVTAAIKGVTVGALRVDYAVNSQPAAAGAAGSVSPLTAAALEAYGSVLDEYRSVRKYAATIF